LKTQARNSKISPAFLKRPRDLIIPPPLQDGSSKSWDKPRCLKQKDAANDKNSGITLVKKQRFSRENAVFACPPKLCPGLLFY
jgi:hypothetical protein